MSVENSPLSNNLISEMKTTDRDEWSDETERSNNSTLLYIAVEYVKKGKSPTNDTSSQVNQESYADFTPQVSPLDPNMSSVAQYSPVPAQYNENNDNEIGPIVIQQYVTQEGDTNQGYHSNTTLDNVSSEISTVLCNSELRSSEDQFFQMVEDESVDMCGGGALQLVPEQEQQGVELLITDHATGISYSVNTQELLVERCLDEDDQQLLEAITPNPILESDLLTLDDTTLKSELSDASMRPAIVSSYHEDNINSYMEHFPNQAIDINVSDNKINTRSNVQSKVDAEEELLSHVYSVMDKPILSRARASLPESYLVIGKVNDENAVFAKKYIPKRTQFGPLEGTLIQGDNCMKDENQNLHFFMTINGIAFVVDVSDESTCNWMSFVRKAATFEEQNLIITQEENGIYFTVTKQIVPKEELKVGYSKAYAEQFNLDVLKPIEKNNWPCYECASRFGSSEELQKHLNVHDQERDENIKPKKKCRRKFLVLKKSQADTVECNMCQEPFSSTVNYNTLKNHLATQHKCTGVKIGEFFTIYPNFECNYCEIRFRTEILLDIHKLEHDPELSLEQTNHVCPQCQRKFPTRRQLVLHVSSHALPKKIAKDESVRCMVCYKLFAHRERLQKHMLVHGSDDVKPLQCKNCKKRFLTNSALSCHLKTHYIGQKNFECPICNEGFDHVLKLKLHVPKHAHNNQYTCPYCKKTFKKYSIIRKHIRAFHREPKYRCPHCPKMFSNEGHLKKHMLRHSDHREFLCADCGKQFKRKDKLTEHIKKIHPDGKKASAESMARRKKFVPKVEPTDFHRFIYKCHTCLVGFKRRGMLVNHLAKRHPDVRPDSVPELNLPILQTTRDYYCQYCDKVYKSSSKRKVHILKNHPGAALPVNSRQQNNMQNGGQNGSFSHTAGSVTTRPKKCQWCHRQYASQAKLLQHVRKEHPKELDWETGKKDGMDGWNLEEDLVSKKSDKGNQDILQSKDYMNADNVCQEFTNNGEHGGFTKDPDGTTEGHISVPIECLHGAAGIEATFAPSEELKYNHLSIEEDDIMDRDGLDSHSSQLYHLLTAASNGMLPPR
ncbi:hypothetical protein GWI33_007562 [Rhynchophorus ferrugineus]|uniref:PR domain zinc finger protein 10 n=1 Tax=Rhynchophorus ferrugineus TaxID=354439 RepID=A0A834MGJ9_RHYFE|nr:hypothetical protein GWI33_007562 [Rhynchophorus ferrugineus]